MTGPKLNENVLALAEGQRSTKAVSRYNKGSASKVRVVLDLIRGLPVQRADEVLQFTDRGAAEIVRKTLASAVANAIHNDDQDPEELFVLAAFADEGPTLKRFRPRARGRASRIRKRTSHVTVVVARLSDDRLEIVQNRQASSAAGRRGAGGLSARSRAERVARSRQRAEGLRDGSTDEAVTDDSIDDANDETVEAFADVTAESTDDTTSADDDKTAPTGSVVAPDDGTVPEGYPIKGNAGSMKFHEPGSRYYDVTIAEYFFDTADSALAAGFEPVGGSAARPGPEQELPAADESADAEEAPAAVDDEASNEDGEDQ